MDHFTPVASAVGGVLIGLSAAALLFFHGRIAGVSGIVAGLLGRLTTHDVRDRALFVAGLAVGGTVAAFVATEAVTMTLDRSIGALVVSGLLVGIGTQLGGGCTSGHGVCGIGRLSKRSIVATVVFMGTGMITTYVVMHPLGGSL
jgi:uncharacterized membrane protein YedE/YeeE